MKILIVDDSAFSRRISEQYITKYFPDASILFAADGKEAIERFDTMHPDYVFVDLLMPHVSGRELIQMLLQRQFHRIVVLSADVQRTIRAELEALQITAFVNKPLNDEAMQVLRTKMKEAENEKYK